MVKLFSYGTLQKPQVQKSQFGRLLEGTPDVLTGYRVALVKIEDAAVLAASEQSEHPILVPSDNPEDTVSGTLFVLTETELDKADAYEVDDYVRKDVTLASGQRAFVYVAKAP